MEEEQNKEMLDVVSQKAIETAEIIADKFSSINPDEMVLLKGDKGEDGRDGLDGMTGPRGLTGKDGKDGKNGKDGKDGKTPTEEDIAKVVKKTGVAKEEVNKIKPELVNIKKGVKKNSQEIEDVKDKVSKMKKNFTQTVYQEIKNKNIIGSGSSTFSELTDTPADYSGQAGKVATVKSDESGLEFTDKSTGEGDMLKSTYDTDDNGVVDNSEKLENQSGSYYLDRTNHTGTQTTSTISDFDTEVSNNTDVSDNTSARHTHSNKTILDNTEESFLTTQKDKLDNISVTQAVDLDQIESDTNTNNAKVSNATHTGEVTGSDALTVDVTAISNKTAKTVTGSEELLINDGGTLKKTTAQEIADLGGGGSGTLMSPVIAYKSTDTTIDANAIVKFNYDSVYTDDDNNFDTANSKFITPSDGVYNIDVITFTNGTEDTNYITTYIYKNGDPLVKSYFHNSTYPYLSANVSTNLLLSAGDEIEIKYYAKSNSIDIDNNDADIRNQLAITQTA